MYETAIGAGKLVVTAHGTPAEVNRAHSILAAKGTPGVATLRAYGEVGGPPCDRSLTSRRAERFGAETSSA
jgi:hypothetical protein